ncbi:hypothetical protein BDN70DRAFT_939435 [Pholiota conissans]|uniref:Helicase C-terminal domain-containing protein n=1 Tax=Pholiota conissans TaxID=109636 RepID=A0A9P5YKV1_9AGAR|nr:hypothetical protein BDN70DRAFT_939435 [Pholiota conissans]
MPSLTVAAALLQLTEEGIPWDYPVWQEATGVYHGLFPDDPSQLPKGWTVQDASDIKSFISRYNALSSEEKKASFLSDKRGTTLPGRKKWQNFANAIWRSCKGQAKIIEVFNAHGCHPYTRAQAVPKEKVENPRNAKEKRVWPSGGLWIPTCTDDIAVALFGEESLKELNRLPEACRPATQALAQRVWSCLTRRLDRVHARLPVLEKEATKAFNALSENTDSDPQAAITTVFRAVARWRNAVKILETPANLKKVEDMQKELDCLIKLIGANLADDTKMKKKGNITAAPTLFSLSSQTLKALATDEDIETIIAVYHDFFDNSTHATDDVPLLDIQPTAISFDKAIDGADLGVEYEADKSRKKLAFNLGFVDGLPLIFNTYRHSAGLTPWTVPDLFEFEDSSTLPPDVKKLELHWHQLAGVHAILRTLFTNEPDFDHCTGVLVTDEVGLGKTYQSATVIACLIDAVIRQREGLKTPPLFEARPYLAGEKEIPSLPHLVLFPGTITSQWFDELRILFQPGFVDLFVYPTPKEERLAFWDENGPFHRSKHALSNRIILSPHSTMTKEYGSLHQVPEKKISDLPWDIPPLLPLKLRPDITKTLFGQSFLSVIIDEAHNFRNHGPKSCAALALLKNTIVRVILTGTPLQTSTKDLAAMGRLTGLECFSNTAAYHEEKEDLRELRRARKEMQDLGDTADDNEQDFVKLCQIKIAQRMQHQSAGHIIRRTTASLNYKGEELVPLPPCETVYVYLDLTKRELKIITAIGQNLEEIIGPANLSHKLSTRGFYIEYRLSLIFARSDAEAPLPKFHNLEEWEQMKSTKLDTAARLCQYFLTRDDLPLPTFSDGTVDFPPIPSVRRGEKISKDCKIVVFTEFPSMISLFINVFELYGVKVLAINGTMSFTKRASIVAKFRESSTHRVLALSSVGTTGINLSFCRIVIFLDQPWSAQDIRQMRGRVHRQPQKNKVICIHLLANETSDIIVDGMARGKRDMMEAFVSKKAGKDMLRLLSGEDSDSDSDESPTITQKKAPSLVTTTKKSRETSVKSTQSKGKAKMLPAEDEDEEDEVALSITFTESDKALPHKSKDTTDHNSQALLKKTLKSKALDELEAVRERTRL